jgi:twinkle protein
MTPYEFARRYLGDYQIKNDEIIPLFCPFCKGGRSGKDKRTFALNTVKMTYNCKRGNCNKSGTFKQLCEEFGEQAEPDFFLPRPPMPPSYKKPTVKVTNEASSQIEEYFTKRKISSETWKRRKVFEKDGAIALPYYEKGELVLIKYRQPVKKGKHWREAGGKPVFWGMDECSPDLPLVITEGEMDTLALDECGIKNVVSVPSGAEDLTCIDLCWDWLEQFKKIIIWGDNDEPGRKMVKKLITRLGEWRCAIIESPHKDANLHLYLEGKESVIRAVAQAKDVPIQGLLRLADVEAFDIRKAQRVRSGVTFIDRKLHGFFLGQISIWTGENSSGKSTLLGQILINALNEGSSVCAYSGELPAPLFRYWIELQMAGEGNIIMGQDEFSHEPAYYVPVEIAERLRKWYRDKFFLYDSLGPSTTGDILRVFEYAARRHDCKVFLVDNLMTTVFEGSESNFYRQQSEFVGRLKDFAHKFTSHVHLVAHPRKTKGEIEKNDVSGSGDITNRADNVFAVERIPEKERIVDGICPATKLHVLKNRLFGRQGFHIELVFSEKSKRFWGVKENENKKYGWEDD